MSSKHGESFKSVLQVLAVLFLLAMLTMIAHKAHTDIATLAEKHSGSQFWIELARYAIKNMAGGG